MSYDIPQMHIPDNSTEARVLESIISRKHVTIEEAVHRAIRTAAIQSAAPKNSASKRKIQAVTPITDEELANLDRLCPALKLLDDVTDEEWDNGLKGARRMNREGFTSRV